MSATPPDASPCMGRVTAGECGSSQSRVAKAAMQSAPTFTPSPLYERLLALPDHLTGEILDGQLHTQSRPSGRHGLAASALNIDIGGPFEFGRVGRADGGSFPNRRSISFATWRWPSLIWRAGGGSGCRPFRSQPFEVVPDWVCEILSPSTAKKDRVIKLRLYARYSVAYAWVVDPLGRTLEAFELRDKLWALIATHQDDALLRVPPFDAIELPLNDLWASRSKNRQTHLCFRNDMAVSLRRAMKITMGTMSNPSVRCRGNSR